LVEINKILQKRIPLRAYGTSRTTNYEISRYTFQTTCTKSCKTLLNTMNSVKQTNEPRPNQIAVFCDRHSKLPAKLCSKCRAKCPPFPLTRACTQTPDCRIITRRWSCSFPADTCAWI